MRRLKRPRPAGDRAAGGGERWAATSKPTVPQSRRADNPRNIPEPYSLLIDARMATDAAHFQRHRDTNTMVREAVAGEFWPAEVPAGARVRVIQLLPGLRVRQVLS